MADILPVIDVLNGQVVRAIAGQRANYRPIQSRLCSSAEPAAVAKAYHQLGFRHVYVADLDAIQGRRPNQVALRGIADQGLQLVLDPGIATREDVCFWLQRNELGDGLHALVAGSESVRSAEMMDAFVDLGGERAWFGLDMVDAQPRCQCPDWQSLSVCELVDEVVQRGIKTLILLDLAAVGTGSGNPTLPLCRELTRRYPAHHFLGGGGVRDLNDVSEMHAAGIEKILVASALHDGRIIPTTDPG